MIVEALPFLIYIEKGRTLSNMQLYHLRYFIAIGDFQSINKASTVLNTTPQNVSRILKSLEGEMNILLFERTADGLELTSEGKEFLQFAKSMVYQFDELQAKFHLKQTLNREDNEITLISSNSINEIILNKILIAFLKKYPHIIVKNTTIINLEEGYENLKTDTKAIAMLYAHPEELLDTSLFTSIPVLGLQPVVISSKDHPLSKKSTCLLKELSQYNLIIYANNTYLGTLAYHYLNLEHYPVSQSLSYLGNIEACYEMAASSNYITTDSLESFLCQKESLRQNLVATPVADLPFVNCNLIKPKNLPTDSPQQLLYAFILNYLQEHKVDPTSAS